LLQYHIVLLNKIKMDYSYSPLVSRPYHVTDLEVVCEILAESYFAENTKLYKGLRLRVQDLY
jgi:hypothetical protein